jgi:hypothetical protein
MTYPDIYPKLSLSTFIVSFIVISPLKVALAVEILSDKIFRREVLPAPEAPIINKVYPGIA